MKKVTVYFREGMSQTNTISTWYKCENPPEIRDGLAYITVVGDGGSRIIPLDVILYIKTEEWRD